MRIKAILKKLEKVNEHIPQSREVIYIAGAISGTNDFARSVNASSEYSAVCNSMLNRFTSSFTVTLSLEIALVIIAGFEDKILKLIVGSSRSVFPHLVHWDFQRFTLVRFIL